MDCGGPVRHKVSAVSAARDDIRPSRTQESSVRNAVSRNELPGGASPSSPPVGAPGTTLSSPAR
ncbi:Uncharacterised protein [Mycobacterium tuberculosis]|nr:Uncharacterised protein [Mycobacterium tuberculosis]